jgi:hypothetical protein
MICTLKPPVHPYYGTATALAKPEAAGKLHPNAGNRLRLRKPMSNPRRIASALTDSPAATLVQRWRTSMDAGNAIAAAAARLAPDFDASRPGACELRDGNLYLLPTTTAQAAKLRQGLPNLQKILQQQGFEVIGIRIRVQPARLHYPEAVSRHAQVGATDDAGLHRSSSADSLHASLRFADKLALTLPESPLRSAAIRLGERMRKALAKTR